MLAPQKKVETSMNPKVSSNLLLSSAIQLKNDGQLPLNSFMELINEIYNLCNKFEETHIRLLASFGFVLIVFIMY